MAAHPSYCPRQHLNSAYRSRSRFDWASWPPYRRRESTHTRWDRHRPIPWPRRLPHPTVAKWSSAGDCCESATTAVCCSHSYGIGPRRCSCLSTIRGCTKSSPPPSIWVIWSRPAASWVNRTTAPDRSWWSRGGSSANACTRSPTSARALPTPKPGCVHDTSTWRSTPRLASRSRPVARSSHRCAIPFWLKVS
ncbi:Uncharacterised protein [Mycobacteroides abscessus]|nr:Uncharacterised protein [Mycobacteroides abscessus]SIJ21629.1 Uncharacterised protein [Mycobacteroides abscessus subsp. abscessus]SIL31884.1 Uncharacterised protein [Mycobacteroides abscessus subsp. abscessus]